jgi:hypothetical protein
LNLDDVIAFRTKEVVVYPDEAKKPEIGQELNRRAEVTIHQVWPVDHQQQVIKVGLVCFFLDFWADAD